MPLTEHPSPAGPRARTRTSPDTLQQHRPALTPLAAVGLPIFPVDGYMIHYPTPKWIMCDECGIESTPASMETIYNSSKGRDVTVCWRCAERIDARENVG